MATWVSLTAEQKDIVLENDLKLRLAIRDYAQALERLRDVQAHWLALAAGIVATLDLGEIVPHASGFAGVQSSTKQFYEAVMTSVAATLTADNTDADRQNYAKLAGPGNIG